MKNYLFILGILLSLNAHAADKLKVDLAISNLQFKKPSKGVGPAGTMAFERANVDNNGIVLNINNVNKYFDSKIFVRPTFLGFQSQFGNYGITIEETSILNTVLATDLKNSTLVMDSNQLNFAGESFNFINADLSIKLNNYRLYCQSLAKTAANEPNPEELPPNMMQNCLNFLTLNGTNVEGNALASLEFETVDKLTGNKTFLQTKVKSFDFRKNQINANLVSTKSVSNDSYIINADEVNLSCAKDADLKDVDVNNLTKNCLNDLKIAPMKAVLVDKAAKSNFKLDVKDISVKNKIVYMSLNSGALSDPTSTTYLTNLILNCKKDTDTDLLELTQVLRDCTSYARISLAEVKSTKPDEKDSSIRNIVVNADNNKLVLQAETKILKLTARVAIYGKVALNEVKKQLIITVTDTKLPLGINSVKLLMYILKKNLISKDIAIENNVITISL